MRKSTLYESLITPEWVERLTKKYHFKGHLGDQDFFSLIGMEHERLFYVLPCTWNRYEFIYFEVSDFRNLFQVVLYRQICDWWKRHGYAEVFNEYFKCEGSVNVWHGNCNTPIPNDEEDDNGNQGRTKSEL